MFGVIENLTVLKYLDSEPRKKSLTKALVCENTRSKADIPLEIIKCGKLALLKLLHSLSICWKVGNVP